MLVGLCYRIWDNEVRQVWWYTVMDGRSTWTWQGVWLIENYYVLDGKAKCDLLIHLDIGGRSVDTQPRAPNIAQMGAEIISCHNYLKMFITYANMYCKCCARIYKLYIDVGITYFMDILPQSGNAYIPRRWYSWFYIEPWLFDVK
jgi:hypothetical protein